MGGRWWWWCVEVVGVGWVSGVGGAAAESWGLLAALLALLVLRECGCCCCGGRWGAEVAAEEVVACWSEIQAVREVWYTCLKLAAWSSTEIQFVAAMARASSGGSEVKVSRWSPSLDEDEGSDEPASEVAEDSMSVDLGFCSGEKSRLRGGVCGRGVVGSRVGCFCCRRYCGLF